jgi:hypothetical protein
MIMHIPKIVHMCGKVILVNTRHAVSFKENGASYSIISNLHLCQVDLKNNRMENKIRTQLVHVRCVFAALLHLNKHNGWIG